jgi:UDP-N-acetylmuramoyl-L-alanyl-D-glutamate--2,6-diaminopimelate ligase
MGGIVKKTLPQLIQGLPPALVVGGCRGLPELAVTGITEDSRKIVAGNIFVAIQGGSLDGHRYIPQAVAQGAAAVVGTQPITVDGAAYIQVEDARQALGLLSAAFYGHPSHGMTLIGVTGTDGKTTTSNMIYQILLAAGLPAGVISTVNAVIGSEEIDTGFHVTTPTAPEIQRFLARMSVGGLSHVVLETTSHGLAQHRVTGCEFDIGVLTNITHEHLNEHGSFESYLDAKASLFTGLSERPDKASGVEPLAVLNRDDPSFETLSQRVTVRKVSYSLQPGADLWAEQIEHSPNGLHFTARGPWFSIPVDCSIMGLFNVSNCLAAIAATVIGLRIDPEAARSGIANLGGVPGRMEQINMGQPFIAIVDFAHTPNALRQALLAARQMTAGRVLAVFGSAGLRDVEKRRLMAEVSAELADVSILTAEDPRTEPLEGILADMAAGAHSRGAVEGQSFIRVADRGEALRQAVKMARPGDLVIACGKGHEQSMCFGTQEYPWDDRVGMRAALAELTRADGPQMPYLPTQDEA